MSSTLKKIIIVIVVLAVGFFIYSYFFVSKKDTTPGLTDVSAESNASTSTSGIDLTQNDLYVKQLTAMSAISFDFYLFKDVAYKILHSPTVIVQDEPKGRHNPFAPIEQGDGSYVADLTAPASGFQITSTSTVAASTSPAIQPNKPKNLKIPSFDSAQ
ncbi:MAG: hypothetical protein WCG97_03020 [bacterium]